MENQQGYEELITAGIKGLPQELLAEIADYVYVVRKRYTQPHAFEYDLRTTLLGQIPAEVEPLSGEWQSLAGSITRDDLQMMSEAIAQGCERIDVSIQ